MNEYVFSTFAVILVVLCAVFGFVGFNAGYGVALKDVCEARGYIWVDRDTGCVSELPTIELVNP